MLGIIELSATRQLLTCNKPLELASGTVGLVFAHFDIGEGWNYPVIKAIFTNESTETTGSNILVNNKCEVPPEVMMDKGKVIVNLAAYDSVDDKEERMTSYSTPCLEIRQEVKVDGANSIHPTPSEFDQFVKAVEEKIILRVEGDTLIFGDIPNTSVVDETLIINGGSDED